MMEIIQIYYCSCFKSSDFLLWLWGRAGEERERENLRWSACFGLTHRHFWGPTSRIWRNGVVPIWPRVEGHHCSSLMIILSVAILFSISKSIGLSAPFKVSNSLPSFLDSKDIHFISANMSSSLTWHETMTVGVSPCPMSYSCLPNWIFRWNESIQFVPVTSPRK